MRSKVLLVTGGAGFIGSNFVLEAVRRGHKVVNLDALTYAGNIDNLRSIADSPAHTFIHGSILDGLLIGRLLTEHQPDSIVHFAAESHVDRSILSPAAFVETNVNGTFALLEAALKHWRSLAEPDRNAFRFLHVSTDEVYGSLAPNEPAFHEDTPYRPNSPYSASKAASDHMVRAYFHTYQLPVVTTNCSNNYGPYQFPEKLIPLMIHNAIQGKPLPVYGDGQNVRDWLYVEDHCAAIFTVLERGTVGETYNVGGPDECDNLTVVRRIIELTGADPSLIEFVTDRPGHDRRYSLSSGKIAALGWRADTRFEEGLERTVAWYRDSAWWWEPVRSGAYRDYYERQYGRRLKDA